MNAQRNRKYILALIFLLFLGVLSVYWFGIRGRHEKVASAQVEAVATHYSGKRFVGSEACAECHADIYANFTETAHNRSSRVATKETVLGSFEPAHNTLLIRDESNIKLSAHMEERKGKLWQTLIYEDVKNHLRTSTVFDIAVGSGRKGQTYLFWADSLIFQLPISYYQPTDSWVLSPGYGESAADFTRPIGPRCLECHTTYFEPMLGGKSNSYVKENHMLGIQCERCHGPSADHVEYHKNNPDVTEGRFVTNAANLSRKLQLDACGLCHAGVRKSIRPHFDFFTGDNLEDFSTPDDIPPDEVDVHGHQLHLLIQSKCFQNSEMTCSSCHDPHKMERENIQLFSQRCMQCHSSETDCGMAQTVGSALTSNCLDCHMPNHPSRGLLIDTGAAITPVLVRTHRIAIYPEESQSYLKGLSAH